MEKEAVVCCCCCAVKNKLCHWVKEKKERKKGSSARFSSLSIHQTLFNTLISSPSLFTLPRSLFPPSLHLLPFPIHLSLSPSPSLPLPRGYSRLFIKPYIPDFAILFASQFLWITVSNCSCGIEGAVKLMQQQQHEQQP
ncbi:hypothetical protein RIF29_31532 [Crotalaria pallida]|uniref:Uncharacterized protein n=1 Tax=Crotalaria pallida TaxID=3830 RepID=A0AAN9EHB0_CROPI